MHKGKLKASHNLLDSVETGFIFSSAMFYNILSTYWLLRRVQQILGLEMCKTSQQIKCLKGKM